MSLADELTRCWDALNEGDPNAFLDLYDPEIELFVPATIVILRMRVLGRPLSPMFRTGLQLAPLVGIAALLLSRPRGALDRSASEDGHPPDVKAALAAAEAVSLMAFIWVAFQGYASLALASMCRRERLRMANC